VRSTDDAIAYLEEAMIEDLPHLQVEPSKFDHGITYDEITDAFVESIEPLLQLANLAYGYSSHTEAISAGRRRALEHVGMRAVDLLTELVTFVRNES
jgi:hypothetical protein